MSQASETQYVFCLIGELLSTSVITSLGADHKSPKSGTLAHPPCVMYVVSLEAREEKNGQESVVSSLGPRTHPRPKQHFLDWPRCSWVPCWPVGGTAVWLVNKVTNCSITQIWICTF